MKPADAFFDTNVLLYVLFEDPAKADRAEELLAGGGKISVQVMNEFTAVARRKLAMSWPEIREVLATIRAICTVVPISEATHDVGLTVAGRYGFSIYDGLIIAAASLAGCGLLYSEDLQDGQVVQGVRVHNPFGAGSALIRVAVVPQL